jgi:hypothetical protein
MDDRMELQQPRSGERIADQQPDPVTRSQREQQRSLRLDLHVQAGQQEAGESGAQDGHGAGEGPVQADRQRPEIPWPPAASHEQRGNAGA